MLLDLLDKWRVDRSRSFLIGDKESDIAAADTVSMPGYLYRASTSANFYERSLSFRRPPERARRASLADQLVSAGRSR
ncbi:hypothetical protein IYX23_17370 [Methylocystis sp. L43]|nr:hypothetical protein [Methylocystis sp. L43]MBG0807225.1 hypothetical protein [Methylocystis sp. H15]